jgi:hypothetical protein
MLNLYLLALVKHWRIWILTRLYQANIKYFLDMSIIRCYLEDSLWVILDTSDINRNNIIWYTGPADIIVFFSDLKYLRPQPAKIQMFRCSLIKSLPQGVL